MKEADDVLFVYYSRVSANSDMHRNNKKLESWCMYE